MTDARRMGSPKVEYGVCVVGSVGAVDALRDCDAVRVVENEEDRDVSEPRAHDVIVADWASVDADRLDAPDVPLVAVGPAEMVTEAMAAGVSAFVPEDARSVVAERVVELAGASTDGSTETGLSNADRPTDSARTDESSPKHTRQAGVIESADTEPGGTDDARSRLATERDRFQTLFDAFPEPVIAYRFENDTTRIHRANTAFGETFGVDPEEVRGERVGRVVVPDSELSEAKRIDEQVRRYESVEREVTRAAVDGRRRFRLQNVPRADDETIDGFAIYADVTATKRRQRELERRNERLDEFASVVSHDLRNPLSVADGNVELAAAMTDDQAVADRLTQAADAIERMGTLIEDLLAVARRGAAVESVEPVDLEELAPVAWQTAATGPVSLSLVDPPIVEADRGRLQQLLENLFRNAADHAVPDDADDPDVTVTVGACADGFYVADDGVGFELADPSAAFDAGVTTADDGTGFGLRIVHEIAEAHGWRVTATDSPENGARFEITGVDRPEE